MKIPKIELDPYLDFLFHKHHVRPGSQADNFETVIDSVVGVHSARLPTPYVAFQARMKRFRPPELRQAIYGENSLIKLRCMRKTLHIVTQELAPIVHQATLRLRTAEYRSKLSAAGFKDDVVNEALSLLSQRLSSDLCSGRDLEVLIDELLKITRGGGVTTKQELVSRKILKLGWELGFFCYINKAEHWSREVRFYGSTKYLYPELKLDERGKGEAVQELVLRHIKAYGPVSVKDITWWGGLTKKEVCAAIEFFSDEVVIVELIGVGDCLYMHIEELANFRTFEKSRRKESWVALLAYEDPTLKGFFETRGRYVKQEDYDRTFNQIGEVRPTIVANGRVVGVWQWNAKAGRVSADLFTSLDDEKARLLRIRTRELEECLNEEGQLSLSLS